MNEIGFHVLILLELVVGLRNDRHPQNRCHRIGQHPRPGDHTVLKQICGVRSDAVKTLREQLYNVPRKHGFPVGSNQWILRAVSRKSARVTRNFRSPFTGNCL